jgi:hypothetical protein
LVEHEFKNCPFVDDKFKRLMKEKLGTTLPPTTMSTPTIHANVPMFQIQSQSGLVIHPTPVNQNLNW